MNDRSRLTHIDEAGDPRMVDVTAKNVSVRVGIAEARVDFPADALTALREQNWNSAKGSVRHTAIIAGTQAVKRTADLIPFCHPLPVERCRIDIEDTETGVRIECEVATTYKTGVEMEAWTGAAVAALTIVDMCKALSPAIVVSSLRLLSKTGGKSDYAADGGAS